MFGIVRVLERNICLDVRLKNDKKLSCASATPISCACGCDPTITCAIKIHLHELFTPHEDVLELVCGKTNRMDFISIDKSDCVMLSSHPRSYRESVLSLVSGDIVRN